MTIDVHTLCGSVPLPTCDEREVLKLGWVFLLCRPSFLFFWIHQRNLLDALWVQRPQRERGLVLVDDTVQGN